MIFYNITCKLCVVHSFLSRFIFFIFNRYYANWFQEEWSSEPPFVAMARWDMLLKERFHKNLDDETTAKILLQLTFIMNQEDWVSL